jgi:hypothetical protein
MPNRQVVLKDVKPITFEHFVISADGDQVVIQVKDKAGGIGHIALNWLHLGIASQLIIRAAEDASKVRRLLGKDDIFTGGPGLSAQLVSTFQVSEYPDQKLKVLSLQNPVGFRCDFAIRTDMVDQRGRSMPRAIAEELLADPPSHKQAN